MHKNATNIYFKLIFVFLLFFIASCQKKSDKQKQSAIETYWVNYDFANQQLIDQPSLVKKPTLSFLNLLDCYSEPLAGRAMELFMDKVLESDTAVLKFTVDGVLEKYLYRADSPIRNENYYLTVIECLINSERLSNVDKIRFKFQKKMMLLNQVGSVATNFSFITQEGETNVLYGIQTPYLLIYFHHPDCYECKRTQGLMLKSSILNDALKHKQLVVLTVFTDNDSLLWQHTIMPQKWINAYNIDQSIVQNNLYDLRAIPSLYLLDKDKRVIIKDGLLDEVLSHLNK